MVSGGRLLKCQACKAKDSNGWHGPDSLAGCMACRKCRSGSYRLRKRQAHTKGMRLLQKGPLLAWQVAAAFL